MPIPRARILQGPCQVQYNGSTFYSKGDVIVTLNAKNVPIVSSGPGLVDYRDDDFMAEINFQPDGQVTNTLLGLLFPLSTAALYQGQSVFPASDTPLQVWTRDGYKHTFPNAAVTKEPGFDAAATKTAFNGNVTFTALRSDNTAWSAAGSLASITAVAYPGDTANIPANIITTPYSARWLSTAVPTGTITADTDASPDVVTTSAAHGLVVGDTVTISGVGGDTALNGTFTVATVPTTTTLTLYQYGTTTPVAGAGTYTSGGTFTRANAFDSFSTEAGFSIRTQVNLSDVPDDIVGVIDKRFQQVEVTCKAIPNGPHPTDIYNALGFQGSGAVRGRSRVGTGMHLYLSGTGLYLKMPNAFLTATTPVVGSASKKRVGETTWKSVAGISGGTLAAPLALSTTTIS